MRSFVINDAGASDATAAFLNGFFE